MAPVFPRYPRGPCSKHQTPGCPQPCGNPLSTTALTENTAPAGHTAAAASDQSVITGTALLKKKKHKRALKPGTPLRASPSLQSPDTFGAPVQPCHSPPQPRLPPGTPR